MTLLRVGTCPGILGLGRPLIQTNLTLHLWRAAWKWGSKVFSLSRESNTSFCLSPALDKERSPPSLAQPPGSAGGAGVQTTPPSAPERSSFDSPHRM